MDIILQESDEAGSITKLIGENIGTTTASAVATIGWGPKLFGFGLAARCWLGLQKWHSRDQPSPHVGKKQLGLTEAQRLKNKNSYSGSYLHSLVAPIKAVSVTFDGQDSAITQVVLAVRAGGRWNGTSSSGIAVYSREASSETYRDWWISARRWAAVKSWQRQ